MSSSVVDDMRSRGEWIEWGIGRPASIRVGWAWALRGAGCLQRKERGVGWWGAAERAMEMDCPCCWLLFSSSV